MYTRNNYGKVLFHPKNISQNTSPTSPTSIKTRNLQKSRNIINKTQIQKETITPSSTTLQNNTSQHINNSISSQRNPKSSNNRSMRIPKQQIRTSVSTSNPIGRTISKPTTKATPTQTLQSIKISSLIPISSFYKTATVTSKNTNLNTDTTKTKTKTSNLFDKSNVRFDRYKTKTWNEDDQQHKTKIQYPKDKHYPISDYINGKATYYTEWKSSPGSCGKIPLVNNIVALSPSYMKYSCGKCISITFGGKVVKALVTDTCAGCSSEWIDLSDSLFQQLSPLGNGVIQVKWSFIDC